MQALKLVDPLDLDALNRRLGESSAEELIAWAASEFPEHLVASSSFGANSAVMLHLIQQVAPGTPILWVDTGYLFPETYRFAEQLRARLDLNLHVVGPAMTTARQEALFGERWEAGPDGVAEYLRTNKVEPMRRALQELQTRGWMAGVRGEQTTHRSGLRRIEEQDGRCKIHPILHWTGDDVTRYLEAHELPRHPLYDQGYRSIGDAHSTLPTTEGMDPRDGRILGKKRECGLHLPMSPEQDDSLKSSGL